MPNLTIPAYRAELIGYTGLILGSVATLTTDDGWYLLAGAIAWGFLLHSQPWQNRPLTRDPKPIQRDHPSTL